MFPQFDLSGSIKEIARGIPASPGAAVGEVVFDSRRAFDLARSGKKVILVRRETSPDDLVGMVAAEGILTSRGGKTSHAAVVARGMARLLFAVPKAFQSMNVHPFLLLEASPFMKVKQFQLMELLVRFTPE
jgi:phosphoenolpyruvate-protein kinase (PTS system EI component)